MVLKILYKIDFFITLEIEKLRGTTLHKLGVMGRC